MLAFSYQCGGGIANKGKGKKLVRNCLSHAALCTAACVMAVASSWASVLQESFSFSSFSSILLTGQVFSNHMSFQVALLFC